MRFSSIILALTATAVAAPTPSDRERRQLTGLINSLAGFLSFDISGLSGVPADSSAAPADPNAAPPQYGGSFLSQSPIIGGIFASLGLKYMDLLADGQFTEEDVKKIQEKLQVMVPYLEAAEADAARYR
jgi:hypothetical protein